MLIGDGLDAVVFQDGVAALDVLELAEDRLGGHGFAEGAKVPLEVADPQDEVGDGGGTRVDLDAEELVRIDGEADQLQNFCFCSPG